jgi:hypothetical protein
MRSEVAMRSNQLELFPADAPEHTGRPPRWARLPDTATLAAIDAGEIDDPPRPDLTAILSDDVAARLPKGSSAAFQQKSTSGSTASIDLLSFHHAYCPPKLTRAEIRRAWESIRAALTDASNLEALAAREQDANRRQKMREVVDALRREAREIVALLKEPQR